MSNLAFCSLLLERYGIEPILHVCGRDRNLLGQMAHLLGAHALGIRNLVIITGDPPKVGDFPEATAVYDLDSIGLLQMAANMNRGIDPAGKPLPGGQTSFLLATGAEPAPPISTRRSSASSARSARRRRDRDDAAGLPDRSCSRRSCGASRSSAMPVLVGVLPLASYRNAEFLHNEVPGMQIPEAIRERMRKTPRRRGRAQGRRRHRARDALRGARSRAGRVRHAAARALRARARGDRRPEALDARGRLQRLPEERQRARDVGLVVHDRDVDLAAALQHAVAQAHLVEPPRSSAPFAVMTAR